MYIKDVFFMDRATIRDVAKACNVSITTVSKALNDYPDVNKNTKEKGKLIFDIMVRKIEMLINTVKADDVSLPLIKEYNDIVY